MLDEAIATRDELRAKLDAARLAFAQANDERQALAFDANIIGGDARKKLDRLNQTRAARFLEVEDRETALAEAEKRVGQAERERDTAHAIENAGKAIAIADSLREISNKIDANFGEIIELACLYREQLNQLHNLGVAYPSHQQYLSFGERACLTALMNTPWKRAFQHLAPGERRTFSEMARDHSAAIRRQCEPLLQSAEAAE